MLEKIKNWIIKIRFTKLMLTGILTMIPTLMLSEYNTILIEFTNTKKNEFMISIFCNIYNNKYRSKFQKERCNKKEYKWNLDCRIDKNNFNSSFQQLVTIRNILKNLTKEETHYSQDEIDILMKKARELDKENIKKDVDNS